MIDNNSVLRLIFGFKLRYLRLEHGKSYAELSKETGLSTSYLNDIEKGKKYPKPDKAALLAKSFGISYDRMVSTRSDKSIQPIIDFISSDFFKIFPSEEFGISLEKVLDVFTSAPNKINAFISTVLKIVRSYQIGQEDFYRVALRSYQAIQDNYLPEIEEEAREFCRLHSTDLAALEGYLQKFGYSIDYDGLSSKPELYNIRSYMNRESRVIYINVKLEPNQIRFQLLKEIGFNLLRPEERPYETILNQEVSFEKLLANFKASYFSISCIIPEKKLLQELKQIALTTAWNPKHFERLLSEFDVTPEMLLQRFTSILPKYFGAHDLFFIKIQEEQFSSYRMTKELHLSQIHNPYSNQLNEHLCERWVSISTLKKKARKYKIDAQISEYVDHENKYLCISISQPENFAEKKPSSVTVGMLITPELRANMNFLKDEKIKRRTVHTTCERCPIPDCGERVAEPTLINKRKKEQRISEALRLLGQEAMQT